MSSLQHRIREASKLPTTDAPPTPQRKNSRSFESCFSAGLDLTEFGASSVGGDRGSSAAAAASAELARRKANDAARRAREEKEEAALERRVADVADLAKFPSPSNDALGDGVPRAPHPGIAGEGDRETGNGRDDNFVRFEGRGGSDGFLSSLVSGHASEGRSQTMSHKSRTLLKNNGASRKRGKAGPSPSSGVGLASSRRQEKQRKGAAPGGGKAAKKSRRSKY